MLLIISQGNLGLTPIAFPMPAKNGVQKILMNDLANEHVMTLSSHTATLNPKDNR